MKIEQVRICPYDFTFTHGYKRVGALVKIENEDGKYGEGDLAPLPERSAESFSQAVAELQKYEKLLLSIEWHSNTFLQQLAELNLLPSVSFALESALFTLLIPAVSYSLDVAALLMGNSLKQILAIAEARKKEGFKLAKLKIGKLSLEDAFTAINELRQIFKLRIDANSRWALSDAIRFFSQFPNETFDYIEDPVDSVDELKSFPFPICVEEPMSKGISLSLLETIPSLKAISYKPTVQGGYLVGQKFKQWTDARNINLVLSSSFESDVGHYHLAATAGRLSLTASIGIGTYHYLNRYPSSNYKLDFMKGKVITARTITG